MSRKKDTNPPKITINEAALKKWMAGDTEDDRPLVQTLFKNLKSALPMLNKLLSECNDVWEYEDFMYRYLHGSFKVFGAQIITKKIFNVLTNLLPSATINKQFMEIYNQGTEHEFSASTNKNWGQECRPVIEALLWSRYILEMSVKYGHELRFPPNLMPSGWASILYFFGLR